MTLLNCKSYELLNFHSQVNNHLQSSVTYRKKSTGSQLTLSNFSQQISVRGAAYSCLQKGLDIETNIAYASVNLKILSKGPLFIAGKRGARGKWLFHYKIYKGPPRGSVIFLSFFPTSPHLIGN